MKKQLIELVGVLLLAACVTASGLWIVETEHRSRQLFIQVEELNREQDQLQIDWGRLQIEQSTWATHKRVASIAQGQLGMRTPDPSTTTVLTMERAP
jgi:cell division protein FtsL